MVMLANVNIKATNEITTTLAQIWRKKKKSASLFLFQFFLWAFLMVFSLVFSFCHYFVSSLRPRVWINWAAYACLCCRLSLAIGKWIFLNFLSIFFMRFILSIIFFVCFFPFCLQFSSFSAWFVYVSGRVVIFFYLKFILIFTGMHGNEVQKKINDWKKVPSFRYMLSFAILFDAIPVLGSSVAFRSFSFSFFLSFSVAWCEFWLCVCMCVFLLLLFFSQAHLYLYR